MLRILQGDAADRAQACCRSLFLACYAPFHACLASRLLFTHQRLALQIERLCWDSRARKAVINVLSEAWHGCRGLSMHQAGSCASGATGGALPAAV